LARTIGAGLRSESLHGALILAALIIAFLWTPISRIDEAYYSSSDLLQDFSLTRIQANYPVGNRLMSDGVTEMKPWAMFNGDELAAGRVPWWNPWNGAGCPHFANYQSAVFSIFSLPGYLLATKAALLAAPFLKLFALGFFTFLFLKKLRLRQIPALIGATAFMFGGHNILLLSFPHVGAQAVLPAGCYFVECALQRFEIWARSFAGSTPLEPSATGRPSLRGPLVGLALTFTLGLLAGQPEVFYFSFVLIASFVAARMIGILVRTRHAAGAVRRLLGLAGKFSYVGLVALGLAAFQLLPFFEFLENSRLFEQRSHVQTPLSTEYWALMLFPDLIGNPSLPYNLSYTIPSPNYELVNMAYAGGLVVFLALVSLAFAGRDKLVLFFALAGTAWVFYAYDLCGAARLFALIPTVDLAPMNRSQGVWLFCLAVLAALAVDRVAAARPRARFALALGTLAAALVFLTTFLIGADRLIEAYATVESDNHFRFPQFVPQHVRHMSELLAAGAFAIAVGWVVRARWVQALCGLAILLVHVPRQRLVAARLQPGHREPPLLSRHAGAARADVAGGQRAAGDPGRGQAAARREPALPPAGRGQLRRHVGAALRPPLPRPVRRHGQLAADPEGQPTRAEALRRALGAGEVGLELRRLGLQPAQPRGRADLPAPRDRARRHRHADAAAPQERLAGHRGLPLDAPQRQGQAGRVQARGRGREQGGRAPPHDGRGDPGLDLHLAPHHVPDRLSRQPSGPQRGVHLPADRQLAGPHLQVHAQLGGLRGQPQRLVDAAAGLRGRPGHLEGQAAQGRAPVRLLLRPRPLRGRGAHRRLRALPLQGRAARVQHRQRRGGGRERRGGAGAAAPADLRAQGHRRAQRRRQPAAQRARAARPGRQLAPAAGAVPRRREGLPRAGRSAPPGAHPQRGSCS
jgi:hypothetical protein